MKNRPLIDGALGRQVGSDAGSGRKGAMDRTKKDGVQALGRGRCIPPLVARFVEPVSPPGFRPARSWRAQGTPTAKSSLRRWASPSGETPTFPVPGESMVAITHTFRHTFSTTNSHN
jgi:hypothetical protein